MARLTTKGRNVLTKRPTIDFVEPELDTTPDIRPISEEQPQLSQANLTRQQIRNLAAAITTLADVVQARADKKAAGFVVDLDAKVDAAVIAAMRRQFPGEDPYRITYDQYKAAKQSMYDHGQKIGDRMTISQDDIDNAKPENIGGFGTTKAENDTSDFLRDLSKASVDPFGPSEADTKVDRGVDADTMTEPSAGQQGDGTGIDPLSIATRKFKSNASAESGGLRPEMDSRAQVIEPLDFDEFQNILIRILVNFIWQTFFRKAFPKFVRKRLPKRIAKYPEGYDFDDLLSIPGVLILGEDLPKQVIPKIPKNLDGLVP